MHIRAVLAAVLLAVALQHSNASPAAALPPVRDDGDNANHQVGLLKGMAPETLVQAAALLSECRALQALITGSSAEAAVEERLKQLRELLPQLQGLQLEASLVAALQAAAGGELAGRLAAAQAPSRLKRVLTLTNIMWFCGCLLVVIALLSLFGIYLAALVVLIPLLVWEALAYAASAALLHRALVHSAPASAPFVALTALLLFSACAGGTASLHLRPLFWDNQHAVAAFCATNLAAYAAAAVRLQAPMLGTLAVWWGVSAVGFFVASFPGVTYIGFTGGLARPFGACLATVLAFLPFKIAPARFPLPAALGPFQTGVWLWCPLVMNLASLINAFSRGNRRGHRAEEHSLAAVVLKYLLDQLSSVGVIFATLAAGILLDVEPCRAVGSVFCFLYLSTKLGEMDWKRAGLAWGALFFGGLLWAFAYCVNTWPHFFRLGGSGTAV